MKLPEGIEEIPSPGLLFDLDGVELNLRRMLDRVGGDPDLLRPHMKTHKCAEVLLLQKELGISSVKCATLSEANLAAREGIRDILVAYPIVGPNVKLFSNLVERWAQSSRFSVVVDHADALQELRSCESAHLFDVYLDLDIGMHRTGISREAGAFELAREISIANPLTFAGVHAYDGHIHTSDLETRRGEFERAVRELDLFLGELSEAQISIPRIVSGGSPTFPFHAKRALDSSLPWQCSPGTPVLWDAGYDEHYPEMPYEAAAFLLTRVISHPGDGLVCLDLGHKAVSAENPITHRVRFPSLGEVEFVSQSEEHLVIRLASDTLPGVGKELLGIPYHVCPSVALHDEAAVIRSGRPTGHSVPIDARSRKISPSLG